MISIDYYKRRARGKMAQGVNKQLPSFISTNTLPPSPLEIRSSPSRYVVNNHDWALLLVIENLSGGWLEMVFTTDEAVSWTEVINPLKGVRSIFCPKNSTFSGTTIESVSWGVPIMPSSNLICNQNRLKTIKADWFPVEPQTCLIDLYRNFEQRTKKYICQMWSF